MSDEGENYPYQGIPDDVRAHVEHFDIDQVRDLDAEQLQVQLDAAKQRKAEADDDVEKYRAAIVDIKTLRLVMAEKEIDEVPELNPSNRTVAATPGYDTESDAESVVLSPASSQVRKVFIIEENDNKSADKDGYYYVEISRAHYNRNNKKHKKIYGKYYEQAEDQSGRSAKLSKLNTPAASTTANKNSKKTSNKTNESPHSMTMRSMPARLEEAVEKMQKNMQKQMQ